MQPEQPPLPAQAGKRGISLWMKLEENWTWRLMWLQVQQSKIYMQIRLVLDSVNHVTSVSQSCHHV